MIYQPSLELKSQIAARPSEEERCARGIFAREPGEESRDIFKCPRGDARARSDLASRARARGPHFLPSSPLPRLRQGLGLAAAAAAAAALSPAISMRWKRKRANLQSAPAVHYFADRASGASRGEGFRGYANSRAAGAAAAAACALLEKFTRGGFIVLPRPISVRFFSPA